MPFEARGAMDRSAFPNVLAFQERIWCASGGARCTEGRRAPTLVATRLSLSERGESGVNRLNDYRSFSDGGGDPLHRPGAHVTNGEDAG